MASDHPAVSAAPLSVPVANERRSGAFRTVRLIARGEDAELMLASSSRRTSPGTPRWVALKRLRPDRLGDAETRDALREEAQLAQALRHPGLPRTFAIESSARSPWLAMQYVDGPDLATLLLEVGKRGRRLDLRGLWHAMVGVAEVLDFLHSQAWSQVPGAPEGAPLLHGDLVPDNVLVSSDGDICLTDLGRAWFVGSDHEPPPATRGFTPALTPEQARGRPVDERSDIFLFGVLAYECLTGRHPFLRDTVHETAREVGRARPTPLEALRPVPPELAALIDCCLDADPARRFATSGELLVALRALDLPAAEDGRTQLAAEIASAFPAHVGSNRPWVLRGGSFHPPFLPMVLSWLPPPIVGPEAGLAASTLVATADGPTQLGPETGRITQTALAAQTQPRVRREPDFVETELALPSLPDQDSAEVPLGARETAPIERPRTRRERPRRPAAPAATSAPSTPAAPPWDSARLGPWLRTALAGSIGAGLTTLVFLLFVPRAPEAPPGQPVIEQARRAGPMAETVPILLQTDPPGALVAVDGEALGGAPVTLRRAPGSVIVITAAAPGHAPTTRELPVPDAGGAFTIQLDPE